MKIEVIDTGYLVEYDEELKDGSDFNAYKYHKFAFASWADMISWLTVNEGLTK